MRFATRSAATLAAAILAVSSVVDFCADDLDDVESQHHRDERPVTPHLCAQCPCRAPTDVKPVLRVAAPIATAVTVRFDEPAPPRSLDAPTPPTPPPTALV